jgi:hypothetical protein
MIPPFKLNNVGSIEQGAEMLQVWSNNNWHAARYGAVIELLLGGRFEADNFALDPILVMGAALTQHRESIAHPTAHMRC